MYRISIFGLVYRLICNYIINLRKYLIYNEEDFFFLLFFIASTFLMN